MIPCYFFVLAILSIALVLSVLRFEGYRKRENKRLDDAAVIVQAMIAGNETIRLESESEGALSRLFHDINSLAAILNAHANNKSRNNEFLKQTIQDISHQLKTPLATLNIYNGILQDEEFNKESLKNFVALSEQELDRIELLVQSLLKITKLDSQTIQFDMKTESAEDLLVCVGERFVVRATQEEKTIKLECNDVPISCDKEWMLEALGNLVKNSLDHTKAGDTIILRCEMAGGLGYLQVEDNGCGIHEEDIYYIFKRFYRSRFSKDKLSIGLGLPLVKSIVESQNGTVEVQSTFGNGSVFSIFLPIPTEL